MVQEKPLPVRVATVAILTLVPLLFGGLALVLGQDANWDLRNYHWYNAYAFLNGRVGFDLLAAQTPTFYNPLLDLPFYLAATLWPAKAVGFGLGSIQGLNFVLLFGITHAVLRTGGPSSQLLWSAAIAVAGMVGAGSLGLLGTTFGDNLVSLALMGGVLWILLAVDGPLRHAGLLRAAGIALVGGVLVGTAAGLKQPYGMYCLGFCLGLLVLPGSLCRRCAITAGFAVGVALAVAVFAGPWMVYLWQEYGNPLFPHFNNWFQSPFAKIADYRHVDFMPETTLERVFFPLYFAIDPLKVGEVAWQDYRIPVLFVVGPLAALLLALRGFREDAPIADPAGARYLLASGAIIYLLWLSGFCIYRYLIVLEMLAPLLIVLAVGWLPVARPQRFAVAAGLLMAVQATVVVPNWGRVPWSERWVEVAPIPIESPDETMVLMAGYQPMSYVLPALPPQVPVVRIQGLFFLDPGIAYRDLVQARIREHIGSFLILNTIPDTPRAEQGAAEFGLVLDTGRCRLVTSNLAEPLQLCVARRSEGPHPTAEDQRAPDTAARVTNTAIPSPP